MTQPLVGKQILIVEDEQVFRSLLDSWFSSLGSDNGTGGLMGWMPLSCWEVSLQT
ncbi:orphan two-component response regulator [Escherichia coli]|uniref:Orphan two-component response regulator n=1 Tax=Escherichia coli TaxID=562 RepID=A0A376D8L9_ECOLX|nr:orphan two-component response regulator [Escherichia coli]